jgi:hypothetical protein
MYRPRGIPEDVVLLIGNEDCIDYGEPGVGELRFTGEVARCRLAGYLNRIGAIRAGQ